MCDLMGAGASSYRRRRRVIKGVRVVSSCSSLIVRTVEESIMVRRSIWMLGSEAGYI